MDDAQQQLVEKIQSSNNVLIAVSRDPNVDQLAALLGLALVLNKQGKHAAAVYSGETPSTIEFLQPESTFEKNTDSLRDFIIALDKSKADKLRYKVEDNLVRIFITPYKTSISSEDLEFSQGDFNVDLLIALGVDKQEDLDEAITAHGRILHDATVASINITNGTGLGSINWHQPAASSLCELITNLTSTIDTTLLDSQIATALLTGIVAETDRFRNEKTSSQTMTASAALLSAGANQELVASKLEEPAPEPAITLPEVPEVEQEEAEPAPEEVADPNNGEIEVSHEPDEVPDVADIIAPVETPSPEAEPQDIFEPVPDEGQPAIDSTESFSADVPAPQPEKPEATEAEAPQTLTHNLGADDNANEATPTPLTPPPADWSLPPELPQAPLPPTGTPSLDPPMPSPILTPAPELMPPPIESPVAATDSPLAAPTNSVLPAQDLVNPINDDVPPADQPPVEPNPTPSSDAPQTLDNIESAVKASEEQARDEVNKAINSSDAPFAPEPVESLNAQPGLENINNNDQPPVPTPAADTTQAPAAPTFLGPSLTDILTNDPAPAAPTANEQVVLPPITGADDESAAPKPQVGQVINPAAPPTVPPPIPFQFGDNNSPKQ